MFVKSHIHHASIKIRIKLNVLNVIQLSTHGNVESATFYLMHQKSQESNSFSKSNNSTSSNNIVA